MIRISAITIIQVPHEHLFVGILTQERKLHWLADEAASSAVCTALPFDAGISRDHAHYWNKVYNAASLATRGHWVHSMKTRRHLQNLCNV